MKKQQTVAVVGAGASGIIVARELLHHGHTPVVFEGLDNVGGVFESSGQGPGGYEGAALTASSAMMMFSDYPWDYKKSKMYSCRAYGACVQEYVCEHQVRVFCDTHVRWPGW